MSATWTAQEMGATRLQLSLFMISLPNQRVLPFLEIEDTIIYWFKEKKKRHGIIIIVENINTRGLRLDKKIILMKV